MNLSKNLLVYLAILLLVGCGNKEKNQYIAGFINPGDFCQKGLASEKAYRFANVPNLPGPALARNECSSTSPVAGSGICAAVHCTWYVSQSLTSLSNAVPTEGIAVNDKHLLSATPPNTPTFGVKIFRVVGLPWTIEMVVSGVRYSGSTDRIRMTQYQSGDYVDQKWDSETSACINTTAPPTPLNIIYVEFLENVVLRTDPGDPASPSIQIEATDAGGSPSSPPAGGDFIVVQDF